MVEEKRKIDDEIEPWALRYGFKIGRAMTGCERRSRGRGWEWKRENWGGWMRYVNIQAKEFCRPIWQIKCDEFLCGDVCVCVCVCVFVCVCMFGPNSCRFSISDLHMLHILCFKRIWFGRASIFDVSKYSDRYWLKTEKKVLRTNVPLSLCQISCKHAHK